jgi:hypothetical protein
MIAADGRQPHRIGAGRRMEFVHSTLAQCDSAGDENSWIVDL